MLASTSITFRTDDETKRQAASVFADLGMDMSTGINVLLRTIVRERGFPFVITLGPDAEYQAWMKEKLAESWERRKDPNRKVYTLEEIKARHNL